MNQFVLWRPTVEHYLAGRDIAFGMDIARACGKTYENMEVRDWRTIAALLTALGWRRSRRDALACWIAPASSDRKLAEAA